ILPFNPTALQKEWAFLCACASPVSSPADIAPLLAAGLNWDGLLDLANEHSMQGVLANRLEELAFAGVPAEPREKLQNRMRAQHLFTLSMTAELFRILQVFSEMRIESVLVKGPLISLLAYGDPAVRCYVDLDLIVRHRDILPATQHMLALGFDADVPERAIQAGKVPGEYLFKRPGTQRLVELHTGRTFRYYPRSMRVEDLYARQRRVPLDGRNVPALSLEDELVLNCIHGAKHFWERLIWVADVTALAARHPEMDWQKVRQAAKDVGAERMLRVALQLGVSVFGVQPPQEMAAELAPDAATK